MYVRANWELLWCVTTLEINQPFSICSLSTHITAWKECLYNNIIKCIVYNACSSSQCNVDTSNYMSWASHPGGQGGLWPPHFSWPDTPTFRLCHRISWPYLSIWTFCLKTRLLSSVLELPAASICLTVVPAAFALKFSAVHELVVGVAKHFARALFNTCRMS